MHFLFVFRGFLSFLIFPFHVDRAPLKIQIWLLSFLTIKLIEFSDFLSFLRCFHLKTQSIQFFPDL